MDDSNELKKILGCILVDNKFYQLHDDISGINGNNTWHHNRINLEFFNEYVKLPENNERDYRKGHDREPGRDRRDVSDHSRRYIRGDRKRSRDGWSLSNDRNRSGVYGSGDRGDYIKDHDMESW